jgi:DNA-binding response OmpR family regulator
MQPNGYRVLIVDDDSNTRTLLKLLLEHQGYTVLLAADGEIGIELARTERPDIVLLDVAMPRRSGREVQAELQADPATADIPLIILSAALTVRERDRWQELPGVVEVLFKPFDIYSLAARIAEHLRGRPARAVVAPDATPQPRVRGPQASEESLS